MSLSIHNNITGKLDYFLKNGKIPNIVFYGPYGSGKRTIVTQFLHKIYGGDKEAIKSYVLFANCSHGKGIRFVREDLKFFAKTHINLESDNCFKTGNSKLKVTPPIIKEKSGNIISRPKEI